MNNKCAAFGHKWDKKRSKWKQKCKRRGCYAWRLLLTEGRWEIYEPKSF